MTGVGNGDIICSEICVPHSLLRTIMNTNSGLNLSSGNCLKQEYECLITRDTINLARNFDVDGEIC